MFYQEDTTKFSSEFTVALADKLAADAAFMITNSTTKAIALMKKFEEITLPGAMSEDSQTQTPQSVDDNDWILAKYAGEPAISGTDVRFR